MKQKEKKQICLKHDYPESWCGACEEEETPPQVKPTIEEKIKELNKVIVPQHTVLGVEMVGITEPIRVVVRQLLLSQHTQDMNRVKETIGEMEDITDVRISNVGGMIRNACRKEVLTKIGGE